MFVVKMADGIALQLKHTKKGQLRTREWVVYVNKRGAYINTAKGKIYLTEKNSSFK